MLDEPTTGLHFEDIRKLLDVLSRLVDQGNSVFVIEHNLDVIKTADWVIDLGPEGGNKGGLVVAEGTPEDIIDVPESYTGQFLAPILRAVRLGPITTVTGQPDEGESCEEGRRRSAAAKKATSKRRQDLAKKRTASEEDRSRRRRQLEGAAVEEAPIRHRRQGRSWPSAPDRNRTDRIALSYVGVNGSSRQQVSDGDQPR